MSDEQTELPLFPTTAPAVFCDPDVLPGLFAEVLDQLAAVVDPGAEQLELATPCAGFTVGELRNHVLGWLQFFAAALGDPTAASERPDPEVFALGATQSGEEMVRQALASINSAIAANVAGQIVTMSSARMAGDGVLAMALGEYIIHGWDLANATGRPYVASDETVQPAHEFLRGTVAPEYRGPDTGFFDHEVTVAEHSSALEKLLGFAGRDPLWTPGGGPGN